MNNYEMDIDEKVAMTSERKVVIDAFHVRSIAALAPKPAPDPHPHPHPHPHPRPHPSSH